mgnify:CR=1 FL=1
MQAFAKQAPLSTSQQEVLRHLEAWAQSEQRIPEDDASLVERRYSVRAAPSSGALELVAHTDGAAGEALGSEAGGRVKGPLTLAPVTNSFELEAVGLAAEGAILDEEGAADDAALDWLRSQERCCESLGAQATAIREALELEQQRCAAVREESRPAIASFETEMRKKAHDAALTEALESQLKPIREARRVAALLEASVLEPASEHIATHALVHALATLDDSHRHVSAHLDWKESQANLAEIHQLRCRALRAVATQQIAKPIAVLTATILQERTHEKATNRNAAAAASAAEGADPPAADGANAPDPAGATAAAASTTAASAISTQHIVGGIDFRFQSLALQLRPWVRELEQRAADHADCEAILSSAKLNYWTSRRSICAVPLGESLSMLLAEVTTPGAGVRDCCLHAARCLRTEALLCLAFFEPPSAAAIKAGAAAVRVGGGRGWSSASRGAWDGGRELTGEGGAMLAQLEALGYQLYDALRPLVLKQQDLDPLCEMIHVLVDEIQSAVETSGTGGPTTTGGQVAALALEAVLGRLLADARERLTFRVQLYLRDRISKHKHSAEALGPFVVAEASESSGSSATSRAPPKTPSVLPMPSLLQEGETAIDATSATSARRHPEPVDAAGATATEGVATPTASRAAGEPSSGDASSAHPNAAEAISTKATSRGLTTSSSGWYPTVQYTLVCLAKVYRCLPRAVFQGLSQELLSECTASLLHAGAAVARASSRRHQQLFLISQMLALREQIAPFDSDFAVTHKALDFSHTREAIRGLASRRQTIGGLGAVFELFQRGAPSLVESHLNAKAGLDSELKHACERFIVEVSEPVTAPLLAFLPESLQRAGAIPAATPSARPPMPSAAAIEQGFVKAERAIAEVVQPAHRLLSLYLPEKSTQAILFGPIKTALLEALGLLQTLFNVVGGHQAEQQRLLTIAAQLEPLPPADAPHSLADADQMEGASSA